MWVDRAATLCQLGRTNTFFSAADKPALPLSFGLEAGSGAYFIEKQQATGAPGLGNLRAEVYNEANAFCRQSYADMKVLSFSETKPPYILGNYPRVSLSFSC